MNNKINLKEREFAKKCSNIGTHIDILRVILSQKPNIAKEILYAKAMYDLYGIEPSFKTKLLESIWLFVKSDDDKILRKITDLSFTQELPSEEPKPKKERKKKELISDNDGLSLADKYRKLIEAVPSLTPKEVEQYSSVLHTLYTNNRDTMGSNEELREIWALQSELSQAIEYVEAN